VLKKFQDKYIRSKYSTKLSQKMIAAQLSLALYRKFYDKLLSYGPPDFRSIKHLFKCSLGFYFNSELGYKKVPYNKKGRHKETKVMSMVRYLFFSSGEFANIGPTVI
jgi:hypothetical protein